MNLRKLLGLCVHEFVMLEALAARDCHGLTKKRIYVTRCVRCGRIKKTTVDA